MLRIRGHYVKALGTLLIRLFWASPLSKPSHKQSPSTMEYADGFSEFFKTCVAISHQETSGLLPASSTDIKRSMLPPDPSYNYKANRESYCDYYGLPSSPLSIYHTGDKWPAPEKWPPPQREARPICNHPVQAVWHTLGEQVYKFLDSLGVLWTTIDPVRFAYTGEEAGPLFLWVGVKPGSLSLEAAKAAAIGCKEILAAAQFPDIEIAFRESIFTRTFGPKLLDHAPSLRFTNKPIDDLRSPFTGMLGVSITPWSTPQSEGTGALYLREGGEKNRIFLLTARHVVLPPSVYPNEHYERKVGKRMPYQHVLILGSTAYSDAIKKMEVQLAKEMFYLDASKRELEYLGEAVQGEDIYVARQRQMCKNRLEDAEETFPAVDELHSQITKNWSVLGRRRLGHVVYAPPISVRTDSMHLSEDWALIEVDPSKLGDDFKGNVIYLGNKISLGDFMRKMRLDPENRPVNFPLDSLLQLEGIVKEEELRQPTLLDAKGEQCIIVMKNGKSTGITIGRGTNLESFVREYHHDGTKSTSMEFAIWPPHVEGHEYSVAFSSPGDSGSVVVDGTGRILGMLTGGAGNSDDLDVSYFTPYFLLEQQIKKVFPDSHLYPVQKQ